LSYRDKISLYRNDANPSDMVAQLVSSLWRLFNLARQKARVHALYMGG